MSVANKAKHIRCCINKTRPINGAGFILLYRESSALFWHFYNELVFVASLSRIVLVLGET